MARKLKILLIEDDSDDVELLGEALTLNEIDCEIEVISEGDKALPALSKYSTGPDVIVMDLNLPKMHGREILALIKSSGRYKNIPLVVLTTSSLKDDIDFAYSMGANQFITKPNTISGFNDTVHSIVSVVNR